MNKNKSSSHITSFNYILPSKTRILYGGRYCILWVSLSIFRSWKCYSGTETATRRKFSLSSVNIRRTWSRAALVTGRLVQNRILPKKQVSINTAILKYDIRSIWQFNSVRKYIQCMLCKKKVLIHFIHNLLKQEPSIVQMPETNLIVRFLLYSIFYMYHRWTKHWSSCCFLSGTVILK